MAITKKDLQEEVDKLNKKYCARTGNELRIQGAYGGYQVQLTGKRRKDGKGYRGMGSGCVDVTSGYQSARNAMPICGRMTVKAMFVRKYAVTKSTVGGNIYGEISLR